MKEDNIRITGYKGTWYVIDKCKYNNEIYYLLENEQFGDECPGLIINSKFKVIIDDTYDDLITSLQDYGVIL